MEHDRSLYYEDEKIDRVYSVRSFLLQRKDQKMALISNGRMFAAASSNAFFNKHRHIFPKSDASFVFRELKYDSGISRLELLFIKEELRNRKVQPR